MYTILVFWVMTHHSCKGYLFTFFLMHSITHYFSESYSQQKFVKFLWCLCAYYAEELSVSHEVLGFTWPKCCTFLWLWSGKQFQKPLLLVICLKILISPLVNTSSTWPEFSATEASHEVGRDHSKCQFTFIWLESDLAWTRWM